MNVVFLPEAEDDIDRLYEFLLPKNPLAAQKAMLAIDEGIDMLTQHPLAGTPMREREGYRQLFVPFGRSAYVLRYRIEAENVIIVRVWHGREARD